VVLKNLYKTDFLKFQILILKKGSIIVNKTELVAVVAQKAGLSKADSAKAVDGILEAVAETLKAGEEVRIAGFGTFSVAHRKATTGRNPRTGEELQIPASNLPKFKPGKTLKDTVN
jgi:DNA-binding protein HU-beta